MNMIKLKGIGVFVACLSLAGCGASGAEEEEVGEDISNVAPAEQLLTRFSYEDLELSFYSIEVSGADGAGVQIGMEESFRSADYLGALRKEHGEVTALEIFNAFAPVDLEAPAALLQQHEAQALAAGRVGADVEARVIDASTLLVDKAIPANCSSLVFPDISPGNYWAHETQNVGADGQYFYLCIDGKKGGIGSPSVDMGCQEQSNEYELTVGICNDTASANPTEFWTQYNHTFMNMYSSTQRTSVPVGSAGRYTIFRVTEGFRGSFYGLGVIGRNSTANASNAHRQLTALGYYPN